MTVFAIGSEFQANSFTTGIQTDPAVAMASDGSFVVTWTSVNQDGDEDGIYAQRFHPDGTPAGSEFLVNTSTLSDQTAAAIAIDADGDFIVTWASRYQLFELTNPYGIYAQRFNANGTPVGSEFQVNTTTTAANYDAPAIVTKDDGSFIVVWQSLGQDGDGTGIFAQRFNANGAAVGNELQVNDFTTGNQSAPAIAVDANGNFIVTWVSGTEVGTGQDGSSYGVYAKLYNANGSVRKSEFLVNTTTTGNQSAASVAMAADGTFVVAWNSSNPGGLTQDGDRTGIIAQSFDADGTALGDEIVVNTFTTGIQATPTVAMSDAGNFVILWNSRSQDGDGDGIYGQGFNADGSRDGDEFVVNTFTTNAQNNAAIATNGNASFITAWISTNQDGDNSGIFSQRFGSFSAADDTLTGSAVDDSFNGLAGNDTLFGLAGNDTLLGSLGDDTLSGGTGQDTLDGGVGDDILNGQGDDDLLLGRGGNDTLSGFDDQDALLGGGGQDVLKGGAGNDLLEGGNGADTLLGNDGNDRLIGGKGNDSIVGSDGRDVIVLAPRRGVDTIAFVNGEDKLELTGSLSFEQLAITQKGGSVVLEFRGAAIAQLLNTTVNDITRRDFIDG
jgi:Ca2+-binding RTX toxin-like protein